MQTSDIKGFVPQTLDQAMARVVASLTDKDRKDILASKNATEGHFSIGMLLRNEWGLWKDGTPFKQDIKSRFNLFGHADDCSSLILSGVFAFVKGKDVDSVLAKEVARFEKHWIKQGLDPATGKPVAKVHKTIKKTPRSVKPYDPFDL